MANQTFEEIVSSKIAHSVAVAPSKYNLKAQPPTLTSINGIPAYLTSSNFKDTRGNSTNIDYYLKDGSNLVDITLACADVNCPEVKNQFEDTVHSVKFDS